MMCMADKLGIKTSVDIIDICFNGIVPRVGQLLINCFAGSFFVSLFQKKVGYYSVMNTPGYVSYAFKFSLREFSLQYNDTASTKEFFLDTRRQAKFCFNACMGYKFQCNVHYKL